MKLIIKLLFVLLFLGVAGLFVLKSPDGNPIISTEKIALKVKSISEDSKNMAYSLDKNLNLNNNTGEVEVYRWKDSQGKWQYSNVDPENKHAKKVEQQINIIPSKPKKAALTKPSHAKTKEQKPSPLNGISPTTISPDKISKLIDDAKNVQQLMDKRMPQIDAELKK